MKKKSLIAIILLLISIVNFAQDIKPKKDKETKKYGYVNQAEEWIVKPIYDDADKFKDGFAKIYLGKKEGLLTQTGAVLVQPQFDDIDKFKDGLAKVKNNKKYGFINISGKILCQPLYDEIEKFSSSGIAKIINSKKQGLIKNDGNVILQPVFDFIESFTGNLANIQEKNLWGLIDISGKILFEPLFVKSLVFNKNGFAIASKGGEYGVGKFGIVKNDGTIIFDFNQGFIHYDSKNFYVIKNNQKWVICDDFAKQISKEFDEFASLSTGGYNDAGMIMAREGEKWGFIDIEGKTLIPFKFDKIGSGGFSQNYCAVKVDEKWGYIDKKGNYFKEPIFEEADKFISILGEILSNVKLDGKEYALNAKTGEMKLKAGSVSSNNTTSQPTVNQKTEPTATYKTVKTTTVNPQPPTDENNWITGTWNVTEEKMGGKTQTGNKIKFVNYTFISGGRGSYIERVDIMANQTQTKNISWTLSGKSLKINGVNYTVVPSPDKKSMTMNGILGTTWKLVKK